MSTTNEDIALKIKDTFEESVNVKNLIIQDKLFGVLKSAGDLIAESIEKGGKLMICGNGGSAADAQHLAAEFIVRLRPHINRNPLPAITLAQDTSSLTACGNDYSFEDIFLD